MSLFPLIDAPDTGTAASGTLPLAREVMAFDHAVDQKEREIEQRYEKWERLTEA